MQDHLVMCKHETDSSSLASRFLKFKSKGKVFYVEVLYMNNKSVLFPFFFGAFHINFMKMIFINCFAASDSFEVLNKRRYRK